MDLNLLTALDVLIAEESVTRAAARMNVGVPVMSRTLARIRDLTGDPVLVRAGRGMALTTRAIELRPRVRHVVEAAQEVLRTSGESESGRTFTIRSGDAFIHAIAGHLAKALPTCVLRFVPEGEEDVDALRSGAVDLDIGALGPLGPEIKTQTLFRDRFVMVVRQGHPLLTGRLTPQRFAAYKHISVSRRGKLTGPIDTALRKRGLTRQITLCVPAAIQAAELAAHSDLVAALPQTLATSLHQTHQIETRPLPIPTEELIVAQSWHPRFDQDPGHRKLREAIRATCQTWRSRHAQTTEAKN